MSYIYKKSFKQKYAHTVELSIYNCGSQKCEPGYTWGPGVRDHYLIHFIVSGKGQYTINNQTYNLSANDVFFAKPSELISYTANSDEPWEYYWVGFNGPYANKIVLKMPFSITNPVHTCQNAVQIKNALESIFTSRGSNSYNEALMVGNLYIFTGLLMQEASEFGARQLSTGKQYVDNAIKFIQFNYSNNIGIDDIASNVGVSRSHLYRVFMHNVGQSPIDYLTNYRINEACYLLKNSNLSIAEIAVSVGFFDQFYFSRVFKKSKGVPPSKYVSLNDTSANIVQTE